MTTSCCTSTPLSNSRRCKRRAGMMPRSRLSRERNSQFAKSKKRYKQSYCIGHSYLPCSARDTWQHILATGSGWANPSSIARHNGSYRGSVTHHCPPECPLKVAKFPPIQKFSPKYLSSRPWHKIMGSCIFSATSAVDATIDRMPADNMLLYVTWAI